MPIRKLFFITKNNIVKNIEKGLSNKRTTTFFVLQVCLALIFGLLYYLAVWYDINYLNRKPLSDDMQLNIFEALHFSLITQTTVGYSGGYAYLSETGKLVNFVHLFSILAVFLVV